MNEKNGRRNRRDFRQLVGLPEWIIRQLDAWSADRYVGTSGFLKVAFSICIVSIGEIIGWNIQGKGEILSISLLSECFLRSIGQRNTQVKADSATATSTICAWKRQFYLLRNSTT